MTATNTANSRKAAKASHASRAAAQAAEDAPQPDGSQQAAQPRTEATETNALAAAAQPQPSARDSIAKASADMPDDYGADVIDEALSFLKRFCAFPDEESAQIVALWCAHTWGVAAFMTTPRLAFLSSQPGSGKTRGQNIASLLCRNSREELDPTGPTLATLMLEMPTLFIDEVDTIFGKGGSNSAHRQLRSILNSGYKRGAMLTRKAGKSVESIPVFGAVCFAGLGQLPDTLAHRSIKIKMRRRTAQQKIDRYMPRMHDAVGHAIGASVGDWVKTQMLALSTAWPEMPEGIEDRAAECAEPLLAIADAAGGHWPRTARHAIRKVMLDQSDALGESPAETVLRDIRDIWPVDGRTRVASSEIVLALFSLESSPWRLIWDPVSASRELSTLLASRGINVRKVKVTTASGETRPLQGYRFEDFALAWQALDAKDAAAAAAETAAIAGHPAEDSETGADAETDADEIEGD